LTGAGKHPLTGAILAYGKHVGVKWLHAALLFNLAAQSHQKGSLMLF